MSRTAQELTENDRPEDNVGSRGIEMLVNWNSCVADFYVRRLLKYWAFPLELAGTRSLEGFAALATKFETDLLGDYAAHVSELRRTVVSNLRDGQGPPSEEYEERLLKAQADAGLIIEQAKAQAERILSSARARAEQLAGDYEAPPRAAARKRA